MKKLTFKKLQSNFSNLNHFKDCKIVLLAKEKDYFIFAIVDTRIQVVDYIIEYRKDLDSFTNVVGIFERTSESTFYWLNKLKRVD